MPECAHCHCAGEELDTDERPAQYCHVCEQVICWGCFVADGDTAFHKELHPQLQ